MVCKIDKEYQNEKFVVWKEWKTKKGSAVKKQVCYTLFFNFGYYLKNNLSNALLVFCDGLENLNDYASIDFSGARMTSRLCDKFGIGFENHNLNLNTIGSFAIT